MLATIGSNRNRIGGDRSHRKPVFYRLMLLALSVLGDSIKIPLANRLY